MNRNEKMHKILQDDGLRILVILILKMTANKTVNNERYLFFNMALKEYKLIYIAFIIVALVIYILQSPTLNQ